jgi:hypothetical protein
MAQVTKADIRQFGFGELPLIVGKHGTRLERLSQRVRKHQVVVLPA